MYSIIFDWKRTLYNPDTAELIEGAKELLKFAKSKTSSLILIGKGAQEMHDEVKRLGVKEYFSDIIFQEGKKDPEDFKKFISKNNPKHTIFIGDRVRSELAVGNLLGATTIWVKNGKFEDELPETENQNCDYEAANLNECLKILESKID